MGEDEGRKGLATAWALFESKQAGLTFRVVEASPRGGRGNFIGGGDLVNNSVGEMVAFAFYVPKKKDSFSLLKISRTRQENESKQKRE